jgi:hypothetical protein
MKKADVIKKVIPKGHSLDEGRVHQHLQTLENQGYIVTGTAEGSIKATLKLTEIWKQFVGPLVNKVSSSMPTALLRFAASMPTALLHTCLPLCCLQISPGSVIAFNSDASDVVVELGKEPPKDSSVPATYRRVDPVYWTPLPEDVLSTKEALGFHGDSRLALVDVSYPLCSVCAAQWMKISGLVYRSTIGVRW